MTVQCDLRRIGAPALNLLENHLNLVTAGQFSFCRDIREARQALGNPTSTNMQWGTDAAVMWAGC